MVRELLLVLFIIQIQLIFIQLHTRLTVVGFCGNYLGVLSSNTLQENTIKSTENFTFFFFFFFDFGFTHFP